MGDKVVPRNVSPILQAMRNFLLGVRINALRQLQGSNSNCILNFRGNMYQSGVHFDMHRYCHLGHNRSPSYLLVRLINSLTTTIMPEMDDEKLNHRFSLPVA